MLAMGRALISRPKYLLVDELSLGLMPKVVDECYAVLRELGEAGIAIILVEQNTERAAASRGITYVFWKPETRGIPALLQMRRRTEPSFNPSSARRRTPAPRIPVVVNPGQESCSLHSFDDQWLATACGRCDTLGPCAGRAPACTQFRWRVCHESQNLAFGRDARRPVSPRCPGSPTFPILAARTWWW